MIPLLVAFVVLCLLSAHAVNGFPGMKWVRGMAGVVSFLFLIAVELGLYISFSPNPSGTWIGGIQSRYFIPVIPVVALLLPDMGIEKISVKKALGWCYILVVLSYAGMIITHVAG
ncbi:hypothetical protein BACT_1244 [Bifidobacterium actinocoloniiforme DSM 22766]|uniref:Uncharacterized protein n=1 Tax=Bifidobacterium actinocoloniiforme DSM 22766 TaxID=1437605 RepID=A0A086Z1Z0_9BIFI|nr:DUF2142 domain-containing protein [Bifidobacterium actinocoloniiforme]AKV55631.1 hypothetical protein AB656_04850 [Bifidobacterium actinocoloniiforme DSM 22766]KFI40540.1 hypothetical protein BACT_1244 [Bifidobacterium actinocoloniiforme DSM 22766]